MARCTESDQAALQEAGPLLRFAAERVKNLDPDLALYIAQAQEAAESDQWTPQISLQFWQSFAKLCDLILPATLDSLAAARETIEPSRLRKFLGAGTESLGERSSRRYLTTMIVLILLILPIQLYVWTCTNLSKKIDDLFVQERAKLSTLQQDYIRIDSDARIDAAKGGKPPTWAVDKIRVSSRSVQDNLDQIETEAHILARISLLKTPPLPLESPAPSATAAVSASSTPPGKDSEDANPSNWTAPYLDVDKRSSEMQTAVLKIQEEANLIVGVFGAYILPVLFGMIGAVAYVIRTISDQIKTSTFAMNSPTRHFMRAGLGAMAGLVVGLFTDLSSTLSLSPLAIAFLAGYGVEAVFSMFDGIVEKFKGSPPQAVNYPTTGSPA